ncbi:uncharacterized protein LOC102081697 isoform X3 [Oreochromis niloticus]|uniref:uncharacterized protein LOC102081697 isoform X3 n=1 Tax=Oreochromis niloticus TaxID=8128 RepID=UPI0006740143|nr:uncharacterized protein LOC102081697 isoform X3 [Oreochromis niloticus]CAI5674115.1 unnamed protein product [Mustela putorius furo]
MGTSTTNSREVLGMDDHMQEYGERASSFQRPHGGFVSGDQSPETRGAAEEEEQPMQLGRAQLSPSDCRRWQRAFSVEHEKHIRQVLQRLLEDRLFVKELKYFSQPFIVEVDASDFGVVLSQRFRRRVGGNKRRKLDTFVHREWKYSPRITGRSQGTGAGNKLMKRARTEDYLHHLLFLHC